MRRTILKLLLCWKKLGLGSSTDLRSQILNNEEQEILRTEIIFMPRRAERIYRIQGSKQNTFGQK